MTFVSTSFIERGEMLSCRSSIEITFLFLTVPDYPACLIYSGYRYAPIKPFRPYRDVVCYRLLTHGSMEVNAVVPWVQALRNDALAKQTQILPDYSISKDIIQNELTLAYSSLRER